MRRVLALLIGCAVLSACMTTRSVPPSAPAPWQQRMASLQRADAWQLDGRAAVALGSQGWQASLDWRQQGAATEVHLSGPLGIGAVVLNTTPAGLSLNGAPPGDAVAQLQARLGFELPLDNLRYWLLGVPDPDSTFDLTLNGQGRALQLKQAGWVIDYDRYMGAQGDSLPAHLVMSREGVRVRIVVDHWQAPS